MNRYWHFPLALFGLLAALVLVAYGSSPVRLSEVRGWYAQEGAPVEFRWTGNRLLVPLTPRSVPIDLRLTLGSTRWPGRAAPRVALLADTRPLLAFNAPELPTDYQVTVPPGTAALVLLSSVDRSPFDGRYLGVQVFAIDARAQGFGARAALEIAVALFTVALLALALAWCLAHGYGAPAGLLALALLVRVFWLRWAPPGLAPAEAASLVDAWSLRSTARDATGHFMGFAPGAPNAPLLAYLEIPFVVLFGPALLAARLAGAILGALLAPLVYSCARRLYLPVTAALLAGLMAALAPWHVALGWLAVPAVLVMVGWAAVALAALWFVQRAERGPALAFAVVAGLCWYADPALRLPLALLVLVVLVFLLIRQGWRALLRTWPALALLTLAWFPANYLALALPNGGEDFVRVALAGPQFQPAHTLRELLPPRDILGATSWLLLALGAALLLWQLGLRVLLRPERGPRVRRSSPFDWWLLLAAALIPIGVSSRQPDAAASFLAMFPPLLVGAGAAALWKGVTFVVRGRWRRLVQAVLAAVLAALIGWPLASRIPAQEPFPPPAPVLADTQPGLLEAAALAGRHADTADEVWIDADAARDAWLYVLAAQLVSPQELQAERANAPSAAGAPERLGKYRFTSLAAVPGNLLLLDVVPDGVTQSGFLVERWERASQQIIVVRRMPGV